MSSYFPKGDHSATQTFGYVIMQNAAIEPEMANPTFESVSIEEIYMPTKLHTPVNFIDPSSTERIANTLIRLHSTSAAKQSEWYNLSLFIC